MVKAVAENEYESSNGRMQPEKVPDPGLPHCPMIADT